MAVSADIHAPILPVPHDVKLLEAFLCPRSELVIIRPALGRRIGYVKEELGHVVPLPGRQVSDLAFVVGLLAVKHQHGGRKAAVDKMPGGALGLVGITVRINMGPVIGTVIAPVGITGNAVPVERSGVTQSAYRHRGARHDLIPSRHDGRFENPEKLVGMAVRMTAGAGKGRGRGSGSLVEGDPTTLEGGMGGILQGNGLLRPRLSVAST